jgi:hypothetical protein
MVTAGIKGGKAAHDWPKAWHRNIQQGDAAAAPA